MDPIFRGREIRTSTSRSYSIEPTENGDNCDSLLEETPSPSFSHQSAPFTSIQPHRRLRRDPAPGFHAADEGLFALAFIAFEGAGRRTEVLSTAFSPLINACFNGYYHVRHHLATPWKTTMT